MKERYGSFPNIEVLQCYKTFEEDVDGLNDARSGREKEFDQRDRIKSLAHLRTFGAWKVISKQLNHSLLNQLVFESSKFSKEMLVEQLKLEVAEKTAFQPQDTSILVAVVAKFARPRYIGIEQNQFHRAMVFR